MAKNKSKKANKESKAPIIEESKVVDIKAGKKDKPAKEAAKPSAKEVKAAKAIATKEAFESKFSKPAKSKAAIVKAIETKEVQGVKSSIEIGGLLQDAKFYFPNGKGDIDGKAWLEWAEESFDYKKAQAHNLVKIHDVFADNEVMIDLKPTVLIALTRDVDMLEAATEAVTKGVDVDTAWVKAWRIANLPAPVSKEASEGGEGEDETEGGESSSAKQREKDDKFIQSLEDRIEELEATNKQLAADLKKATKGGKEANSAAIEQAVEEAVAKALSTEHSAVLARMSKLAPNLVLGVKDDASARQINQAVTSLDKIYGTKSDTPNSAIMEVIKAAQGAMKK
tara:strand:+ start:9373 stop:10389 length:1017 start_codon:yes stop_codon:yes gene_type:complete